MMKEYLKNAHGGELKDLMADEAQKARIFERKLSNLDRVNLTDRQVCDLKLIMNGGFSPLEGFMTESDYKSVVENMRLANGVVWPMPVVLDVSENTPFEKGDEIILCDGYGNPLALLEVESRYKPDKKKEAVEVYGTNDDTHPGVGYLLNETKEVYLGGKITGIRHPLQYDFKELRKTPAELRKFFYENGWNKVVGFQTRNPMHKAHFELVKRSAEKCGAKALIHPVVGMTKEGDIDYLTRVKCYKILYENYAKDFSALSLLPLAMRMAGPREALWHAIIRKNYGCTHFIVGRDHAGPGKNKNGRPFYGPYDAHRLVEKYAGEIGITLVLSQEIVYVPEEKKYMASGELSESHKPAKISGTEFRAMLAGGKNIPEWFSFPEIIRELRSSQSFKKTGIVVFLTGLPSSGKSTIAGILASKLLELQPRKITLLDGDIIRQHLSKGLGFSKEDRNRNITRIGFVAGEVAKHGGIAICSAIAPYESARKINRSRVGRLGRYIEVFVNAPLSICKQRDVKGLYKKAEEGKIKSFTGVDDPYEEPIDAEIVVDSANVDAETCADIVIRHLKTEGLI